MQIFGLNGMAAAGQDTSYLKFTATPGSWRFSATYSNLPTATRKSKLVSYVKDVLRLSFDHGRTVAHVTSSGQFRLQIFDMSGRECIDFTGNDSKDIVLSEKIKISGTVLIRLLSTNGMVMKKTVLYW
jgi:hypothetical protein